MDDNSKKEFLDTVDKIIVLGIELKKQKKEMEEDLSFYDKNVKEEQFKLLHAREEFEKAMAKNAESVKEAQAQLKIALDEAKAVKQEANNMLTGAQDLHAKAEKAFKSAEAKESQATTTLAEAQRLKDEYQAKIEKARAMAQALG